MRAETPRFRKRAPLFPAFSLLELLTQAQQMIEQAFSHVSKSNTATCPKSHRFQNLISSVKVPLW